MSNPPSTKTADEDDLHSKPWFGLAYLIFVYLPLVFWQDRPMKAVLASAIATVVFLPLYFGFYRVDERYRLWMVFAVAAVGYGLIPFNPGGNTFIIYALAMLAIAVSARQTIVLAVFFVLLMALEFWWVMPSPFLALGSVAVVAVIGTMVVAGNIYSRARWRRNAELRLTQDEVRRLASMAERERIGRDLHDLLGHTLSVVALKSELAGKLLDRDVEAARAQIHEVETVARQALAQVREAVAGIRATGLQAELASARLALLSAEVRLDQRLAPLALEPKVELALAMIVREAVTNVIRHAGARQVDVELVQEASGLRLVIADDGRGGVDRAGNGLEGMRERVRAIAGSLEIESPPGGGTRLVLRAPLAPERSGS
ncbi:sensor histidine kinase [Arenimonas oryziterrae]|uniref:Histidine kinase/HSP90-like ATPase domain-containing protein n=1 Tax=Arenimonas oryziterrae DSM 21050 = YC6267 TaxID=1121015 RepID=A0A091BKW0_9GAMM|nr:sensor histidine kinase [Arenimonas oryziterrae]KFN44925.1 hypothetical protein N789_02580 [Arenimonas oryziterrae DSM 21050 = YC6267]